MLISTPICREFSVVGDGVDGAWIMVTGDCSDETKYLPAYYLVRGDILSSQKNFFVQIHILGYWK